MIIILCSVCACVCCEDLNIKSNKNEWIFKYGCQLPSINENDSNWKNSLWQLIYAHIIILNFLFSTQEWNQPHFLLIFLTTFWFWKVLKFFCNFIWIVSKQIIELFIYALWKLYCCSNIEKHMKSKNFSFSWNLF